jgi:tetratricopeptide (TPR) repeat protein
MRTIILLMLTCILFSVGLTQNFFSKNDSLFKANQFEIVKQNALAELTSNKESIEANYFLALITIRQQSSADQSKIYTNNIYSEQFQIIYRDYAKGKKLMYGDQIMLADVRFVNLFYYIGLKYFSEQDFKKSAEWLNLAKVGYLNNFDYHFYTGCSYYALQNYGKAKEYFESALTIKPNDAATLYNMACLYSFLNNPEESSKYLKMAISQDATYKEKMSTDSDFNNVRGTKEFQQFISK